MLFVNHSAKLYAESDLNNRDILQLLMTVIQKIIDKINIMLEIHRQVAEVVVSDNLLRAVPLHDQAQALSGGGIAENPALGKVENQRMLNSSTQAVIASDKVIMAGIYNDEKAEQAAGPAAVGGDGDGSSSNSKRADLECAWSSASRVELMAGLTQEWNRQYKILRELYKALEENFAIFKLNEKDIGIDIGIFKHIIEAFHGMRYIVYDLNLINHADTRQLNPQNHDKIAHEGKLISVDQHAQENMLALQKSFEKIYDIIKNIMR